MQRSNAQNRSIHKHLELLADALDREGHTMQDVVKEIRRAEIRPTKSALKECLWKPIQEAMYGKRSTTELTTAEVDRVYEAVNLFMSTNFEIHVPFPSADAAEPWS